MNPHHLSNTPPRCGKHFAEFFAGIGLVHEGLRASGWTCVYANDIEPKKREMYAANFGPAPYYHIEDIWNADNVLARFHHRPFLATASFPCIDLSVAGHWRGFDGEHSSTYFGFLEVLRRMNEQRPSVVMLENVNGFLTSNDGKDFERAVLELASLGYWVDAISLDAKYFVPQSRPRTFVFGFHESLRSPCLIRRDRHGPFFANPWRIAMDNSARLRPESLLHIIDRTELPTGWATCDLVPPRQANYRLADFLDLDEQQLWWDHENTLKHYVMMETPSRSRVDEVIAAGETAVGAAFRRTRGGKTRTEVRFDLAGCLRTPKGGSAKQIVVAIVDGKLRMRWMSPLEYARLQGAPSFPISVAPIQALYGFGDAVCVPAIEWIDANILSPIFDSSASATTVPESAWTR